MTSRSALTNSRELGPWLDGEDVPSVYDAWCDSLKWLDTDGAVAALADLAAGGPVLELAIGTGRIALPLSRRGLEVHGVDASEDMVAKLREKPGGSAIPVTIGDLTHVPVSGRFRLIFVVFNTFFGLRSTEDQQRCFARVAEHLNDDGAFVVEVGLPSLKRFGEGEERSVRHVDLSDLTLVDEAMHDASRQRIEHRHILMRRDRMSVVSFSICYAYPGQLDEMAAQAGLRLGERWGGWHGEPFDDERTQFISIYRSADKP